MKQFVLIVFISILMLTLPSQILSAEASHGNRFPFPMPDPRENRQAQDARQDTVTPENTEEENDEQENEATPTPVVTSPPATPTVAPTVQATPIPTSAPTLIPTRAPVTDDDDNNAVGGFVAPNDRDSDRSGTNNQQSVTASNESTAPVSTNTTAAINPPDREVAPLAQTNRTPQNTLEKIIPPELASLVNVKGENYYKNANLSQGATTSLLSLSLVLFLFGITLLRLPHIMRFIEARRQKRETIQEPFSIPYLELKSSYNQ